MEFLENSTQDSGFRILQTQTPLATQRLLENVRQNETVEIRRQGALGWVSHVAGTQHTCVSKPLLGNLLL